MYCLALATIFFSKARGIDMLQLYQSTQRQVFAKISDKKIFIERVRCERRRSDGWGSGWYGAPRGEREHSGIDFLAEAGGIIYSPVSGMVTKHGICYSRSDYNYIQITDNKGNHVRLFYVEPMVVIGTFIEKGAPTGILENLQVRYHKDDTHGRPIPNHCHVEIKLPVPRAGESRSYIDPDEYDFT